MEKRGGGEGAPGDRDKTPLGIHCKEVGNGSGVGCPTTSSRGLCKRDGVQGRGEGAGSVVASDNRGKAAEDHAKRDFGSGEGAAATGIWQAW